MKKKNNGPHFLKIRVQMYVWSETNQKITADLWKIQLFFSYPRLYVNEYQSIVN